MMKTIQVVCLFSFFLSPVTASLRIWRVLVPEKVLAGADAVMECQWRAEGAEVNGEGLYSLKWYHGLHEFYRWTPSEFVPLQVFDIPESVFAVDRDRSSQGRVVVRSVQLGAGSAPLRCEISGEAPFFQTDTRWAKITVVVAPTGPLVLRGETHHYPLDSLARLTCSAPPASPVPYLAFTINQEKVPRSFLEDSVITPHLSTGLSTVSQSIQFHTSLALAQTGTILVRCSASLPDLYWKSAELQLRVDVPEELKRTRVRLQIGGASVMHQHSYWARAALVTALAAAAAAVAPFY